MGSLPFSTFISVLGLIAHIAVDSNVIYVAFTSGHNAFIINFVCFAGWLSSGKGK